MTANFSVLNSLISDMFTVLDTLIQGIVDLMTGNLLVLAVVGAIIALIVGLIYALLNYVKKITHSSIKMKGK